MRNTRTPQQRLREDDGFTVAELIVAIGVILVVLIASLGTIVTVLKSQRFTEGTDRATQLANAQIASVQQLSFQNAGFFPTEYDSGINADYDNVANAGSIRRVCTTPISTPAACPAANIEEVAIIEIPNASTSDDIVPVRTVNVTARDSFTISTYITWTNRWGTNATTVGGSDSANERYGAKRVRVVVEWRLGNQTKSVQNTVYLTPTPTEIIPNTISEPTPRTGLEPGCPGLVIDTNAFNQPVLSWDLVMGANQYKVYRDDIPNEVNLASTELTYTDTRPIAAGQTVTYDVIARGTGNTTSIGCTSLAWQRPTAIPPCASDIRVEIKREAPRYRIRLYFTPVASASGYRMYKDNTVVYDGKGETLYGERFIDYLENSSTANYRVVPYNAFGQAAQNNGCYPAENIRIPQSNPPCPALNVTKITRAPADDIIRWEWEELSPNIITGYRIYRNTDGGFVKNFNPSQTTYDDYTETRGTHRLRIVAVNANDVESPSCTTYTR